MRLPVKSKQEFVRRFQTGEFGNRPPTWDSVSEWAEWYQSKYPISYVSSTDYRLLPTFHLRNRKTAGPTRYGLRGDQLLAIANESMYQTGYYVSQMCPHEDQTIQGEVRLSPHGRGGLELFYTSVRLPMREALDMKSVTIQGLQAELVIRKSMSAGDTDWIKELLQEYPDHTVEFTAFNRPWGSLADYGYRAVIWEVRAY